MFSFILFIVIIPVLIGSYANVQSSCRTFCKLVKFTEKVQCVRNLSGQIAKRKEDLGNLRGYSEKEGEMGAEMCI